MCFLMWSYFHHNFKIQQLCTLNQDFSDNLLSPRVSKKPYKYFPFPQIFIDLFYFKHFCNKTITESWFSLCSFLGLALNNGLVRGFRSALQTFCLQQCSPWHLQNSVVGGNKNLNYPSKWDMQEKGEKKRKEMKRNLVNR